MKSKASILIVEDEIIIAQDLKANLQQAGYTVHSPADTAKKALEMVRHFKPDLALVDIVLKGDMDGIMLAKQITAIHDIPIIFTSAYSDLRTRDRAKITRPFGYLLKPYNYKEVYTVIEMALYRHMTDQKLMEQAQQYQNKLHHLTAHLQSVREDERTRIAREIHDDLGQSLTALKIDLSWLKKRIDPGKDEIHIKLKAMSAITDHLLQSVKRISTELRPGLLDDLGLAAAMEWQANEFAERTGIQCNVIFKPKEIEVEEPLITPLFRIFQEALTNTARHASATKVNVMLQNVDDSLELTISDNGRGITDKEINDPNAFGIMGIRERTSHLGGRLDIKGNSRSGTTITVRLPHQKQ